MHCNASLWTAASGWRGATASHDADLVLYFAAPSALAQGDRYAELKAAHPHATIVGCSTGGEILGSEVHDDSVVAVSVKLERSQARAVSVAIEGLDSRSAGEQLGRALARPDLRAVFVLSDGLHVNGTELIHGVRAAIAPGVVITGGLAGDGGAFQRTLVGVDGPPRDGCVGAVGLYGDHLRVGYGSEGGWESFGPERKVTRSVGNVLFELNGIPALSLYKRYLGPEAAKLPGSALLFPLHVQPEGQSEPVVRTILGIDEAAQSMTFAGDIPQGARAWFMRGAHERLVQGAESAVDRAMSTVGSKPEPGAEGASRLSILVSCIGRKTLMGQRVGDEVEAAVVALGEGTSTIGFYSYGEIAPDGAGCSQLHNQSMTVTTLFEE